MIHLRARATTAPLEAPLTRHVWLVTDRNSVSPRRSLCAYLLADDETPSERHDVYLRRHADTEGVAHAPVVGLPETLHHLSPGDVISLTPDGTRIRVLWRHRSRQNSVLLTERCDHYCIMCS